MMTVDTRKGTPITIRNSQTGLMMEAVFIEQAGDEGWGSVGGWRIKFLMSDIVQWDKPPLLVDINAYIQTIGQFVFPLGVSVRRISVHRDSAVDCFYAQLLYEQFDNLRTAAVRFDPETTPPSAVAAALVDILQKDSAA
jgi:hypothetical protein